MHSSSGPILPPQNPQPTAEPPIDSGRHTALIRLAWQCRHGQQTPDEAMITLRTMARTRITGREIPDREITEIIEWVYHHKEANMALSPGRPYDIAQHVSLTFYGGLLRYCQQTFFLWDYTQYERLSDDRVRADIYSEVSKMIFFDADGAPVRMPVNKRMVDHIVDALKAVVRVATEKMPAWIPADGEDPLTRRPEPNTVIAFQNGLMNVYDGFTMSPHSPGWFSETVLPFSFSPDAKCPQWESFLFDIFEGDIDSIRALRMWFGLCLTWETSLQKALLLVGPPRAGKGTIGRILMRLIGEQNCAAPSLGLLASDYGLSVLVGKQVAICFDAHLPRGSDGIKVMEILKSIIGEDQLTCNKKYKDLISVKLSCRFAIIANEIPSFLDASGAISSRFILLVLKKTYLNNEDYELENRLLSELPGIANWALDGLKDLMKTRRLLQPDVAKEVLNEFQAVTSPIATWVEECCQYPNPGQSVASASLYTSYSTWCAVNGRESLSRDRFGVALRSACPRISRKRAGGGSRAWMYSGISLLSQVAPLTGPIRFPPPAPPPAK